MITSRGKDRRASAHHHRTGRSVILFAIAGRRFTGCRDSFARVNPRLGVGTVFVRSPTPKSSKWRGSAKLLKWTVPGLAHFFTMWGFTVLLTTIIEAYGALFDRNFHIPWIGTDNWLAFTEDFFATAVLVALCVFTIIRLKNAPAKKERASRFYGSHTGAAWAVLAMIALVIITLLLYRGAQINTGHFPFTHVKPGRYVFGGPNGVVTFFAHHASPWAFASKVVASWLAPLGYGVNSVLEAVFLLLNIGVIAGFHGLRLVLQAPTHLPRADQRRHVASSPRPRRSRQDPQHGHGASERGHGLRRGQDRGLHLEADARPRDLHRVRSLPERCAPRGRRASRSARSFSSWDCATTCSPRPTDSSRARPVATWRHWCRPRSIPTCSGRARRAAAASSSVRSTSSTSTPSSTCAASRS